nr:ubiquitin-like-conjugating enzyme ATG10 [Lepeophtheirus salmonis]
MSTISENKFIDDLKTFISISNHIEDDWIKRNENGHTFISKRVLTHNQYTSEYHVIYSHSYGVPIIYIRLYDSKGQLILDPSLVGQMSEKYLSPVPHPIFGSPYLHIHPCKTAEVMEKIKDLNSKNYLISFLSTMGLYVGLSLSLEYAKTPL